MIDLLLAETKILGISMHPWKVIGLSGSAVFGMRFLIQWIASEKARRSVIPNSFWICSVVGSLLTLSYFACYQKDSVGIIMTCLPLPVYLRNLYFVMRTPQIAMTEPNPSPKPPPIGSASAASLKDVVEKKG